MDFSARRICHFDVSTKVPDSSIYACLILQRCCCISPHDVDPVCNLVMSAKDFLLVLN